MPYDVSRLDLDAEERRLADRYATATERAADDSLTDAEREQARQVAAETERHAAALEWLLDRYGGDWAVRLGGLTMGEDAKVTDRLEDARAAKVSGDSVTGMARNLTLAAAVPTAPFYDDTEIDGGADSLDDRLAAVADLPRHVGTYLYDRVAARESLNADFLDS